MRQVFVGDQAALVDQLIASSQIRAPANSTYTGFGRELVPFDFELHDVVPKPAAMLLGALEDNKNKQRRNNSPRQQAAPSSFRVVPKKVQKIFAQPAPQQQCKSPRRQCKKQAKDPQAAAAAPSQTFVAPGFRESPRPEAVPLPTMALMHKALAKAVARSCRPASQGQAAPPMAAVRVAAA